MINVTQIYRIIQTQGGIFMKKYLSYLITNIILLYGVPFIISLTPLSSLTNMFALILGIFFIAICALLYGRKYGFSILLPIISIIVFLPFAIVCSYSPLRIFCCIGFYFIACIIGNLLGLMFRKTTK